MELRELARDGHYGLIGLHERAERAGGELAIRGLPGGGTAVTARLPRSAEAVLRKAG